MKYWKVYYEKDGFVTHGFAQAPDYWNRDRVRRTMKLNDKIEGPVLVEPGQAVDVPDFVLEKQTVQS